MKRGSTKQEIEIPKLESAREYEIFQLGIVTGAKSIHECSTQTIKNILQFTDGLKGEANDKSCTDNE